METAKVIEILRDQAESNKNRASAIDRFNSSGLVDRRFSAARVKEYSELAEAFSTAAEIVERQRIDENI